jgi:pyridoxal 5'-phosphate synthase pdxS subunit
MTELGTMRVKGGLAEMLKGGVIMDVTTAEQARIAEDAGAVAVMALERVPADIRAQGGVARMADPTKIKEIQEAVTIPVMAKCRIGHFVEAEILEALEVDYVDESEVLTPADEEHHVDKWKFRVPFVCGCRNLGEALRRINEGAAMIRTKGEAGTGDIVNAVRHMRAVMGEIRALGSLPEEELFTAAKELQAPFDLVMWAAEHGRLPVVMFSRHVHRRRHRNACRRRAVHAPRRRRRIRRLWHLQERGAVGSREGDRRGHDALPRPRDPGSRLGRSRRADARPRHRIHAGGRALADPRLVVPARPGTT